MCVSRDGDQGPERSVSVTLRMERDVVKAAMRVGVMVRSPPAWEECGSGAEGVKELAECCSAQTRRRFGSVTRRRTEEL